MVGGEEVKFASPADAIASGIGMVHQHFKLIDTHQSTFTAAVFTQERMYLTGVQFQIYFIVGDRIFYGS